MGHGWDDLAEITRAVSDGVVCVAMCGADVAPPEHLLAALSAVERTRMGRFHQPADAARFAWGRILLRRCLGSFLGRAPQDIAVVCDGAGKPGVAGAALSFNLSHSDQMLVLALRGVGGVGVDVEHSCDFADRDDVAARFFHPFEAAHLARADDAQKTALFYEIWTRKEAYVKARGLGLAVPPDSFAVHGDSLAAAPPDDGGRVWQLCNLALPPGYVGALAYDGGLAPVRTITLCARNLVDKPGQDC